MSEETIPCQTTSREEEEDVETTCASTTGPAFMLDVTHSHAHAHTHTHSHTRTHPYLCAGFDIYTDAKIYSRTIYSNLTFMM